MKRMSLAALLAITTVLIGLADMVGWIAHIPMLISVVPGYVYMVFNTGLCLTLCGIALFCRDQSPRQQHPVTNICATITLFIALVTFSQYIFGASLGIDQLFITGWMNDENPFPGRMGLNTCIALTLTSTAILLMPLARSRWIGIIVQACIFLVLILGLTAFIGYVLKLGFLYSWFQYTRMAIHTSFCFALLGFGMAITWSNSDAYLDLYKGNEDKKILVISGIIVLLVASVSGLSGFSTSTKQNEAVLGNYLKQTLQNRIGLFESAMNRPIAEMGQIRKSENLAALVGRSDSSQQSADLVTSELFTQSHSAIEVRDKAGNIVYAKGNWVENPDYAFSLKLPYNAQLLWKDGFTLKLTTDLIIKRQRAGTVSAEWALDGLNQLFANGDFFVCSMGGSHLTCLPRASDASVKIFSSRSGQDLLSAAAGGMKAEMIHGKDVNRENVMALYQPVNSLNLGFVYKAATATIYQPMRNQLEIVAPLILVTIGFGMFLLYWQVLPLLRKVLRSEKRAHESSIRLNAVVNHVAEGIMTISADGSIETFNPVAEKTFGYKKAEVVGKKFDILLPDSLANKSHMAISTNTSNKVMEISGRKKDGTVFPMEYAVSEMEIDGKHSYVGIMRDITERKAAEEKLQESEYRFRLAFDSAATGMSLVSLDGRWLKVNPILSRITGYTENELLSMRFQDITHPDDLELTMQKRDQLLSGGMSAVELEKRYYRKDGALIWVLLNISLVRDKNNNPQYFIAQTQEVTQKKKEEEELSYQAYYDALTGLVNRNHREQSLDMAISSALRNQKNFAVFFIDLDHFKQINDTLGHDVGDELLKIVADRLKNSTRLTDVAARLGGDEFILILNGINTAEAAASFAEKIIGIIIQPIKIKGHELYMTMSIGISFFPNDGVDYESLIKSADLALYRAKGKGRNNYQFCTPEMNNEITDRLKFKNALQVALDKKEFHLDYLPKLEAETNKIVAVEGLLRWKNEQFGDVAPSKIIPVAEESGMIIPLSEWIIGSACEQGKIWQSMGMQSLNVAVNVSSRQFKHPGFTESALTALKKTGMSAYHLELEISESLLMQDPEYSLRMIRALKDIGIQVTMDNFGTGYSSLVYLHRFSVDRVKIDRTLIQQMTLNSWHASLVSAIVTLARDLGIRVAAEGVETQAQFDLLRSYGCSEIQGFFISKPLSLSDATQFLTNTNKAKSLP